MDCIAVLPYYRVQREVTGLSQEIEMNARTMTLYSDRIVTKYREFRITEVFDMSFRRMGDSGGFLSAHEYRSVSLYGRDRSQTIHSNVPSSSNCPHKMIDLAAALSFTLDWT